MCGLGAVLVQGASLVQKLQVLVLVLVLVLVVLLAPN
jgi:hypothetical protein